LQQDFSNGVFEGKFYGIFVAKHDWSFLDNNDENQFLKNELGKSLTFRVLLEPLDVYERGVSEWEALDEIKNISSPNQMLWSLIYRKLKGNRGNTMITIYEAERLCKLIRDKNKRTPLNVQNKLLLFDLSSQSINAISSPAKEYTGRAESLDIFPRLKRKYTEVKAFESHLQNFIVKNIGKNISASLDSTILSAQSEIEWLGNEVSCGVGMQRIDVLISSVCKKQRTLIPIELKAVEASKDNVRQIQRYLDWLDQYYIPNRPSDIAPVLISRKVQKKDRASFSEILDSLRRFNALNHLRCHNIKYIEYEFNNEELRFQQIEY
jgi:hypothetical protein